MASSRPSAWTTWLFALVLGACAAVAGAQPAPAPREAAARGVLPKPPQRMVFVGNSLTFYHGGVHEHLRAMLQAQNKWMAPYFQTQALLKSNGYLHEQSMALQELLGRGLPWDVVVLQGYSREPVDPDPKVRARFEAAVREMNAIVRDSRSRAVLYMTWGYRGQPEMGRELQRRYREVGDALGIPVIPAGVAFERGQRLLPHIPLIEDDLRHPTPAGTLLVACVFYAAFEGRSPEGNPHLAGLPKATVLELQRLAWDTVRGYYGW